MDNLEQMQSEYVKSFNEKEKKAYEIAKSHLGMSFDLEKSIGFQAVSYTHLTLPTTPYV